MPRSYLVKLYTPHEGQKRIHASKARFRIINCGRRFGKTVAAANECCKFACENKDTLTWWVAPTYKQAKIAFRQMKKALESVTERKSDVELRIELKNGAVIECRSGDDPDNLRGEGVHFLVMEEAAMMPDRLWYEILRPMLSDTNGMAIFISTPKGRNWFYVLYMRGQDPLDTEYDSFTLPTSANPYVPQSEIEAAKHDLPEDVFRQEFLAEFLEESAGVFRKIDQCIAGELYEELEPVRGHGYVLGWDPAKYQDFSVITVMDIHTRHVVWWDRTNKIDYTYQLDWVADIAIGLNAYPLMDMTGVGDPLLEQLKKKVPAAEGYLFNNSSKKELIENLVIGIQDRALTYPDIPVMVAELRQMEFKLTPSRLITYSAPEGAHDDCVISLALAYYAITNQNVPLQGEEVLTTTIEIPTIAELVQTDPFAWADMHTSWGYGD